MLLKPRKHCGKLECFQSCGVSMKGQQRAKTAPSPKGILLEKKTAPLPKSHLSERCAVLAVPGGLWRGTWVTIPYCLALVWFGLVCYIWTFKRQILPCSESVKHKCILITWHPLMKTLHQPCMSIQYLNTVLQLCYVHYKCE